MASLKRSTERAMAMASRRRTQCCRRKAAQIATTATKIREEGCTGSTVGTRAATSVGITAAVSTALARVGISCNVLAGYYHDHLLVPAGSVDEAIDVLGGLES